MSNKPIKIKRNTSVSGKSRQRKMVAKKVFGLTLLIGGLLAIGYLGAPAVIELITSISTPKPPIVQPDPQPSFTDAPEIPQMPEMPEEEQQTSSVVQEGRVYSYIDRQNLMSEEDITQTAKSLYEKGINYAVVTLKDENGNLHYDTQNEIGTSAKSNTLLDISRIAEIFSENNVELVADIYAFKDKTTPNIKRETAVKYIGTDMNWWDNSKEFGGKPWANPASEIMQNYLYDIVAELSGLGVKNFVISAVQLPTGYSLDKRDFGVSESQLQAQIQGFINTMELKAEAGGGKVYFSFDMESVNGGDYTKYIVAPYRYGADNLILVGNSGVFKDVDLNAVKAKIQDNGHAEKIVFWNTDENLDENSATDCGYFVK